MLRAPGFPRAIGGAYRLDTLAAWEEDQLAGSGAETAAEPVVLADAGRRATPVTPTEAMTPRGEAEAWSPSTRRPAAARGRARKSGGE